MKNLVTILGSALLGGSVVFGATLQPADTSKPIILQDNVESHSRLLEPPIWDTSVVSSKEITDAYIAIAEKYGVTTKDLTNAGGNLQTAIQSKLQAQGLLCTKI